MSPGASMQRSNASSDPALGLRTDTERVPPLQRTHPSGHLEQIVRVLLRIDHERPGDADLPLPVPVDVDVGPAPGSCALEAPDHLAPTPERSRGNEEPPT